jgi:amino-acid N-acetyltransferase
MSTVQIRSAVADDQETIKSMVREEQLDPTSLHWSHFVVAEHEGEIVGIGQIRPYPRCRELGSLVVREGYRDQGIGGQIIHALLANETGDVYLECDKTNETYYAKFGFRRIPWYAAPYPLNLKVALVGILILLVYRVRIIAMHRPPDVKK